MKKAFILCVALFAFIDSNFAQIKTATPTPTVTQTETKMTEVVKSKKGNKQKKSKDTANKSNNITADLNLTKEQQTRLNAVEKDYREKVRTMKGLQTSSKHGKDPEMEMLKKRRETDLRNILDMNQYTRYEELRRQRSGKSIISNN